MEEESDTKESQSSFKAAGESLNSYSAEEKRPTESEMEMSFLASGKMNSRNYSADETESRSCPGVESNLSFFTDKMIDLKSVSERDVDTKSKLTEALSERIMDSVSYISNPKKQQWVTDFDEENFKILDPDDPLMKRFQDALKSHLLRMDNKLNEEISDLETALKEANKARDDEGAMLYEVQQEAARQEAAIENYKDMLAEVTNMRGDVEERLIKIKETFKKVTKELEDKKNQEKKLIRNIESLDTLQMQLSKWESELAGNLSISERISEKDTAMERELLYQKQQRDFLLYKIEDEVWKLQTEIKDLEEQLQIKNQEKVALSQTLADANTDLECLEKEHKTLYHAWNSVLTLISQRDTINEEIITEQRKIRENLQNLQTQIDKLKKDSEKEMDQNERLTNLQLRFNEEIKLIKKSIDSEKEKYYSLETEFTKFSKLVDQSEKEYAIASTEYELLLHDENALIKEILKFDNIKRELEEKILLKLDDKITHDKEIKYLNRLLHEAKDSNVDCELNLSRNENAFGKALLDLEKLNSQIENEKFDLDCTEQKNAEKQKEIDRLQSEIKNYNVLQKQKERKIMQIQKKIEELLEVLGREDINPLDLHITVVERNIEEHEGKIKKAQQFWLRQQGYMYTLSRQRDSQMQELSVMSKEIMLMEQKNVKLETELEKQRKEEANMNRTMNSLQQKLLQINLRLVSQRDLKNELQDKNNIAKNEYIIALKKAETELIQLESDIKNLHNEKNTLKEELKAAQQECLSWEKKVQLSYETSKVYKEERTSGDIATMKSEIHKMEMRLSYLKKAQEKLVQDMEFCISRRDNIIDEAMAREKKNPKSQHNQRIVLRKRLDDQRVKIKQISKEIKLIENKISNVKSEKERLLEYLNEGQSLLRQNEDIIPDIEKQITEAEMIKNHNLEILVRKQRKVNMLRDLRNGRYKPLMKSELAVTEEWENQAELNNNLKEIMNQTDHDFPLLKTEIKKIKLSLEAS